VINQKVQIRELSIQLNQLVNRDLAQIINPTDTITLKADFDLPGILQKAIDNNAQLKTQELEELIAISQSKIARGQLFPEVELFGNYDFNRQTNEVGFLESSRSFGPDFGVSVRFNLFSGSQERIARQNAEIAIESEKLRTEDLDQEIKAAVRVAYLRWQSQIEQVNLEKESVKAAQKTLEIANKQYELGAITNVDFRIIQLNAINARTRFLEAQYNAKSRELELLRLSGELMDSLL
jgi:outer membrane protein TolC